MLLYGSYQRTMVVSTVPELLTRCACQREGTDDREMQLAYERQPQRVIINREVEEASLDHGEDVVGIDIRHIDPAFCHLAG